MPVITVTGEISKDELGITDIHEHILCDFSKNYEPPEKKQVDLRKSKKLLLKLWVL